MTSTLLWKTTRWRCDRHVLFAAAALLFGLQMIGLLVILPVCQAASTTVVINEVYSDAVVEPDGEWIELRNLTSSSIDLGGWSISDGEGTFTFNSGTTLPASGFLLLVRNQTQFVNDGWTPPGGTPIVEYGPSAGNLRLANDGDDLILRDNASAQIDEVSYGNNTTYLNPAAPKPNQGQSIERTDVQDSDDATDWSVQSSPSPGTSNVPLAVKLSSFRGSYSDFVVDRTLLSILIVALLTAVMSWIWRRSSLSIVGQAGLGLLAMTLPRCNGSWPRFRLGR